MKKQRTYKKTMEQSFMWMLHSLLNEESKFNASQMIESWFGFAFDRLPLETEYNSDMIDKIRLRLLEKGGLVNPKLKDSCVWKKIKSQLIFE